MVQPENRQSTMSHYLAAIAVADTIVLGIGKFSSLSRKINRETYVLLRNQFVLLRLCNAPM